MIKLQLETSVTDYVPSLSMRDTFETLFPRLRLDPEVTRARITPRSSLNSTKLSEFTDMGAHTSAPSAEPFGKVAITESRS